MKNIKIYLSVTFIVCLLTNQQSLVYSSSTGDKTPIIKVTSSESNNPNQPRQEFYTTLVQSEKNKQQAIEMAAQELAKNPNAERAIVLTSVEGDQNLQESKSIKDSVLKRLSELSDSASKEIKSIKAEVKKSVAESISNKSESAKKFFFKHERISLTFLRTTVNGGTVTAGLIINSGLPPSIAIGIGLLSGGMSGLFQYFNPSFQKFIEGNHQRNTEIIENKRLGTLRVKSMQMTKWFLTEVTLYGIIKGFSGAVGVPMDSLTTESLRVLKSSLLATASQGLWDSTIASQTRDELRLNESDQAKQRKIQMRSNIATFGVSMVSVFGGVLSLMGSNLGTWTLGALGATGVIYTIGSWKKRSANNEAISRNQVTSQRLNLSRCRTIFN